LEVEGPDGREELTARHVILATGSRPFVPPEFGYDGSVVITTDEAVTLPAPPERVAIIGGGPSGCEFASLFAALGSAVVLIEAQPQLLPAAEPDVARQLQSLFKRRGIGVHVAAGVRRIERGRDCAAVELATGERIEADRVLVTVGRRPRTEELGLSEVGIALNARGEVEVDARSRTAVEGIYAVGDMTDVPWKLAHVAAHQGVVAAENAAGRPVAADWSAVPMVVFSTPEVAWVGMTTPQAEAAGLSVVSGRVAFGAVGRAVIAGETEGFIKILSDSSRTRIVGLHLIGPEATSLIGEATLAVRCRLSPEQLAATLHAHPTLSEGLGDAAAALLPAGA
ncbi:MAG TPA: FAD-dependent oxidoreductase, partial [Limnochordia bacterium]